MKNINHEVLLKATIKKDPQRITADLFVVYTMLIFIFCYQQKTA